MTHCNLTYLQVNNIRVYPDIYFPGFSIRNNGINVRLATNFSLVVESDGKWTSVIKVNN